MHSDWHSKISYYDEILKNDGSLNIPLYLEPDIDRKNLIPIDGAINSWNESSVKLSKSMNSLLKIIEG